MLETIISWLSTACGEAIEAIINLLLSTLSLDLNQFVTDFPIIATSYEIFQAVGLGLVVVIAVFQLTKFFAGSLAETKDTPVRILIRSAFAVVMIWFGGYILTAFVELAKTPYDVFVNDVNAVSHFNLAGFDVMNLDATDAIALAALDAGAILLLSFVLMLLIGFNVLKLCIEVCERFLMVGVLVYTSPLIYPTLSSSATSQIFRKWTGMFFGQCILMTLSVWSLKLIMSGFTFSEGSSMSFVRLLLTLAMCKIAQRIDTYMQQLGIGVAATGGNLVDDIMGVAMAARKVGGSGKKTSDTVLGSAGKNASKLGGVAGLATNVFGSGIQAFKNGENATDIKQAMGDTAKQTLKDKIPMHAAVSSLRATRAANMDKQSTMQAQKAAESYRERAAKYEAHNGTGRGYSKELQQKASAAGMTAQQYAQAHFKSDGAGSISRSPQGGVQLDETAKNAGLKWTAGTDAAGQPNQIQGTSEAVGEHIAANYQVATQDPEYQAAMVETALSGSSDAAREALMNPNEELTGNDQLGAAAITNGFGEELSAAYDDAVDSKGNYTEMAEFTSALQMTAEGNADEDSGLVKNIKAAGGTKAGEGRVVSCDYRASTGEEFKVEVHDKHSFDSMNKEDQKSLTPMMAKDGTQYYTKASKVVISEPKLDVKATAQSTTQASQSAVQRPTQTGPRTDTKSSMSTSSLSSSMFAPKKDKKNLEDDGFKKRGSRKKR